MSGRIPVGIWTELPPGSRWANEGIHRVLGFTIEGGAVAQKYKFIVCVPHGMAATVRADFRSLHAKENLDWEVVEPPAPTGLELLGEKVNAIAALLEINSNVVEQAIFANAVVQVDGWIVAFPHFTGSLLLEKPRATLLPDAIPFDFPLGWGHGAWDRDAGWDRWRQLAGRVLRTSKAIVAHSKHVARRHGVELLACPPDKIVVNPHSPPDLRPLLPFLSQRTKTTDSLAAAADILRDYAAEQGWNYLSTFPFETVEFVVVSTQDRPTKNISIVARVVDDILRTKFSDIKLITTARLDPGVEWRSAAAYSQNRRLQQDILSMPDLPRIVHAALYHCAALTVHPSFYEGIVGTLTFFESVSVGTPCLMALGPHIAELLEIEPALQGSTFDPYDDAQLSDLIIEHLKDFRQTYEVQLTAFNRLSKRGWDVAADTYCTAAIG